MEPEAAFIVNVFQAAHAEGNSTAGYFLGFLYKEAISMCCNDSN